MKEEDNMRRPIQVLHKTQQYQVIFRKRNGVQNWSEYVEAETPNDAVEIAKNYLASDCAKGLAGTVQSWKPAEVWDAESRESHKPLLSL